MSRSGRDDRLVSFLPLSWTFSEASPLIIRDLFEAGLISENYHTQTCEFHGRMRTGSLQTSLVGRNVPSVWRVLKIGLKAIRYSKEGLPNTFNFSLITRSPDDLAFA
ncbi:hypothetical protein TNCV_1153661 [Trichonephila clavipes]|nr:hypothetical protein TNCV_1153661 [Trichonephila clavipes]